MQGLGNQPLRLRLGSKYNPFRMWEILQQRYAVVNVATKVQLQYQLSRLVYRGQRMSEYVDQFQLVFNKLAAMDCEVSEDMRVASLLASFGDKGKSSFGPIIAALQSSGSTLLLGNGNCMAIAGV